MMISLIIVEFILIITVSVLGSAILLPPFMEQETTIKCGQRNGVRDYGKIRTSFSTGLAVLQLCDV